jgi:transposase
MFNDIIQKGKEIIHKISEKMVEKKKKECNENDVKCEEMSITDRQCEIIEKLSKGIKVGECIKGRAKILIKYKETLNKSETAKKLNTSRNRVARWVNKWKRMQCELNRIEIEEPHKLKRTVIGVLSDSWRSGKPPKIKSEQVASIIFISLQKPELLGLPISHWTTGTLRNKAIEMGIVDTISERQVGRYLKQMEIKVHQYQGWLNSIEKNPDFEEFKDRVKKICDIYRESEELAKKGIIITSTDEKTGIQAIEHKFASKPVKPGSLEKIEAEYKRHGITTLIATRDINSGQIIESTVQPTRNEKDYEIHIQNIINQAPEAERIMIMDQLNTHMSESMVKLIAANCGIPIESLGVKGKSGILKTMESRKNFRG